MNIIAVNIATIATKNHRDSGTRWCSQSVQSLTHRLPLVGDVLRAEVGVWIDSRQFDAIGLSDLHDLVHDTHDGHTLFVCLWESGLKLVVSCDQTLMKRRVEEDKQIEHILRIIHMA